MTKMFSQKFILLSYQLLLPNKVDSEVMSSTGGEFGGFTD